MKRILSVFFLFVTVALVAQSRPTVFQGAKIFPVSGEPIENGTLIVQHGKIAYVGDGSTIRISSDSEIYDITGKVIIPGLVDTHSHVGGGDGGDQSNTLHPEVRILDAIDVRHDRFKTARAGGVTTANVMPGSGYLMSGQTAYLKLRPANSIYDMLFCEDVENEVCGGLKMANGTNSLKKKPPFSGTRAKSAAMVRQLFIEAQAYQKKIEEAGSDESKLPPRNLRMETLVEVLEGKRIVHHHTHRHDDILTVLRLSKEFGFRVVLHHVSEAWMVADEIAASGAQCSAIMIDSPGGKLEAVHLKNKNGAVLEEAGVDVAFHTDDGITDSRLFLRSAAMAVRYGMSREKALEALTLAGARMMDLEDRIGSLEGGKDADFVVLSGDPLSVYTKVEQTWIEGKLVFDRSREEDRKYAVGGFNVFRHAIHVHEEGHVQ